MEVGQTPSTSDMKEIMEKIEPQDLIDRVYVPLRGCSKKRKQPLFSHKCSMILPSGDTAMLMASNNNYMGDPDFKAFYNSYKRNWNFSDGWLGVKVTTQRSENYYMRKARRDNNVYPFMSDINTMYWLLKDGHSIAKTTDEMCRRVAQQWNMENENTLPGTRTVVDEKLCIEFSDPIFQLGSFQRCYLVLIVSSWHFTQANQERNGIVRMPSDGIGLRVQLKYMSRDFSSATMMKQGGTYMQKVDWIHFLTCNETRKWIESLEKDDNITIQQEYPSKLSQKMSDKTFGETLEQDLKDRDESDEDCQDPIPLSVDAGDADDEGAEKGGKKKKKLKVSKMV